jgi:hypothetical protein
MIVMLSAATNAKHEARPSNISSLVAGTIKKDLRLKAWPCAESFQGYVAASLRSE